MAEKKMKQVRFLVQVEDKWEECFEEFAEGTSEPDYIEALLEWLFSNNHVMVFEPEEESDDEEE